MQPLWHITLLGETTLQRTGSDMVARRFRSQKVASLLAFLAFHRGRAFSREFLCEMLWPDEVPEVTRNRLRVTLASLRRQLEPPGVPFGAVLETAGSGAVGLRAGAVTTDVALLEDAVKRGERDTAERLFRRGSLLPSCYEEWVLPERERLERLGEQALALAQNNKLPPPSNIATEAVSAPSAPALPLYLTRFIGRENEKARLAALLADSAVRLVTVTGPGGNGKTRLAVETVRDWPSLCAFVPLADLWDASRLGDVLRQALALPTGEKDSLAQVAEHLRARPACLLALDNAEQIAPGAALVVSDLLARVPNLTILVTSRRRLDVPGERELPLEPLPLPPDNDLQDAENTAGADSVRLFLDRAQSLRPDFQITPHNAAAVGALCRRLDGIPLALELAAARAGTLTPAQMLESLLSRGKEFVASPRENKEERHRSLSAAIDWSAALLPPDLRRFFLCLSVFRGGWETEAAAAVTGEALALDFLSRLRGHSLVSLSGSRFHLLETLRAWADERLPEVERDEAQERHAAYFLQLGEAGSAQTGGPAEKEGLDSLQKEEANLRVAFDSAMQKRDAEIALRLSLPLYTLGRARLGLEETLRFGERVQIIAVLASDTALRARVLVSYGSLTQLVRGPDAARPLLHAALSLAKEAGDTRLKARALRALADCFLLQKEDAAALPLYEEALALQEAAGDERGAAQTLNSLALVIRRFRQDTAAARQLVEQGAAYYRSLGDGRMLSYSLFNLSELLREAGEDNAAERSLNESLALAKDTDDDWQCVEVCTALAALADKRNDPVVRRENLTEALRLAVHLEHPRLLVQTLRLRAESAGKDGEPRLAAQLFAAADALCRREDVTAEGDEEARFEGAIGQTRAALGARAFRTAWREGAALTPKQAVALAAQTPAA